MTDFEREQSQSGNIVPDKDVVVNAVPDKNVVALDQKLNQTEQLVLGKLDHFKESHQLTDEEFNSDYFLGLARLSFDKAFQGVNLGEEELQDLFEIYLRSRTGRLTGENLVSLGEKAKFIDGLKLVPDSKWRKLEHPTRSILSGEEIDASPFAEIDDFISEFQEKYPKSSQ